MLPPSPRRALCGAILAVTVFVVYMMAVAALKGLRRSSNASKASYGVFELLVLPSSMLPPRSRLCDTMCSLISVSAPSFSYRAP
jgi:hypothetical protein